MKLRESNKIVNDYKLCITWDVSQVSLYTELRREARDSLTDGRGHKPCYSIRTLCRALKYIGNLNYELYTFKFIWKTICMFRVPFMICQLLFDGVDHFEV